MKNEPNNTHISYVGQKPAQLDLHVQKYELTHTFS